MRHAILAALVVLPQDDWKAELKDVRIPMRDGKALAADVFLPPKAGKYPTVLIQTPYNKKSLGRPIATGDDTAGETGRGAVSDALGLLDREHYAYVVVDWRGFYGSKGAMEGVKRGAWKRGQDGFDCVEWIAVQPWSDGKVGTWGGSALGKQQFDTAAEKPPHLVCSVPLIAAMGQTYDSYYEGGVLLEGHVDKLDQLGFGVGKMVKENPSGSAPVWKFAERQTVRLDLVEVPCLLITGWWDNYPDWIIQTYDDLVAKAGERARKHSKLLIGPWDHVSIGIVNQGDLQFEKAAKASADAAKAFLDFHLRDARNEWDRTARVRYWTVGEEEWRTADSWAAVKRSVSTVHLSPDGSVGASPAGGKRTYRYDARSPVPTLGGANLPPMKHGPTFQTVLDSRKDVLSYSSGKLEKPLRINGNVEVSFEFEANRECVDFVATLCEVCDGKPVFLAQAALRTRPKGRTTATVKLSVVAAAVREWRLYVTSGCWPRYERNPHTGADHWDEKSALDVEVTLHHETAQVRIPVAE
jgi:hypothetical protein